MSDHSSKGAIEGVFVPMFTPFTRDAAAVNDEQLRANVRYLIERGIRLINPTGTTGEFWTLSPLEHRQVILVVLEEARASSGREPVMVVAGTSSSNLATTIELGSFAAKHGARAILLTLPYYLPLTDDDAVAWYREVSRRVDADIMLYEMPRATGVLLRGDLLERICDECPRAVALKTAAPADSPREFERLVRRFGQRLQIFSATGTYYSPFTYMTGVHGITDTLANFAPAFGLSLHRLGRARRWEEMNELYQAAFDVLEIELLYGREGLKAIGNLCGLNVGPTRFPMSQSLSSAARDDIRARLIEWSYTRSLIADKDGVAGPREAPQQVA